MLGGYAIAKTILDTARESREQQQDADQWGRELDLLGRRPE